MKQINIENVIDELEESFGINFIGYTMSEKVELRPNDFEFGEGFTIKVKLEWRNLSAEFIPDNFSAPLLKTMGSSDMQKRVIFKQLAQKCSSNFRNLHMEINGEVVSPLEPEKWSENWNHLYLRILNTPIIHEELTISEIENAIMEISGDMLGLILSLLPLEEFPTEDSTIGLPEGALTRIEVNRYERSIFNRQACLRIHGSKCLVCDFDFEEKYGYIGKGFIHVHHVVPASKIGLDYKINPEKDLVPVCPNCHAMIHRNDPPYSLQELKCIISLNKKVEKGY